MPDGLEKRAAFFDQTQARQVWAPVRDAPGPAARGGIAWKLGVALLLAGVVAWRLL